MVKPPVKRSSVVPTPLPETGADWRNTISEVKRKFANRKYRSCSTRCVEILNSLKDDATVDTIYLVYLHFYAASSLEMSARPLSQSTAYRTSMLNDSRDHYLKASELIQKAEDAAIHKRPVSAASSADLSMQSPSLSEASQETSSVFTAGSSPRSSVSSVDDFQDSSDVSKQQIKKKKVSFSGLPEILKGSDLEWRPEPFIRPDSPTLGWEENHLVFGGQPESIPEYVLSKPLVATPTRPAPKPVEEPVVIPALTRTPSAHKQTPPPALKPVPEEKQEGLFDLESFLQAKSMNRIVSQFAALRSQIAYHYEGVEGLLAEVSELSETPDVPEVPALPALTHSRAGSTCSVSGDEDHDGLESPSHLLSVPPSPGATMLSPSTIEGALSQRLKDAFGSSSSFDLTLTYPTSGPSSEAATSRRPSLAPSSRPHSRSSSLFSLTEGEVSPQPQQQTPYIPESSIITLESMEATGPRERSQRNSSLPGGTTIPAWMPRDRSGTIGGNTAWSQRAHSSSSIALPNPYLEGNGDLCPWDRTRSSSITSLASSYSTRPPSAASSTTSYGSRGGDEAIQARIERLRASGWQRKRFDSRRYEALREQVLSELDTP
jgi:hypothetical protein